LGAKVFKGEPFGSAPLKLRRRRGSSLRAATLDRAFEAVRFFAFGRLRAARLADSDGADRRFLFFAILRLPRNLQIVATLVAKQHFYNRFRQR
jgi:hypothetical protein